LIILKDIKLAINNLIEATFPEIEISSKDIKEGFARPSFFVDFETTSKHSTDEQIIRELQVIIYSFLRIHIITALNFLKSKKN
jgi:hypothetical protein